MPIREKYKRKSPQNGEAGFTLMEMVMVIVIASILGIFIFGVLSECLLTQRKMQLRKERSDDAIRTMDKVNRELREAVNIVYAGNDQLIFEKSMTSSQDPNLFVHYIRDPSDILMRQSGNAVMDFWPWDSTIGDVIATDITQFYPVDATGSILTIQLDFDGGNYWKTVLLPRNYN
jgi:prepilin-type N-terminal cleavage/methylation domain-containing protein